MNSSVMKLLQELAEREESIEVLKQIDPEEHDYDSIDEMLYAMDPIEAYEAGVRDAEARLARKILSML